MCAGLGDTEAALGGLDAGPDLGVCDPPGLVFLDPVSVTVFLKAGSVYGGLKEADVGLFDTESTFASVFLLSFWVVITGVGGMMAELLWQLEVGKDMAAVSRGTIGEVDTEVLAEIKV